MGTSSTQSTYLSKPMPSSKAQGSIPVRASSRPRQMRERQERCPLGRPSKKGEDAKRAVATGWSARATRSLATMSASEPKSRFAWTVQVRYIIWSPCVPTRPM
jgi:ParB-like chromosome segregation protein Spo0J